MKTNLIFKPFYIFLFFALFFIEGCGDNEKVDKHFEAFTWGAWKLHEIITPQEERIDASSLSYTQYLERKYDGFVITGPKETTEMDSVFIFKDKVLVFSSRVDKKTEIDFTAKKVVSKLTNGQYYSIKLIGAEEEGNRTGNDMLLVSEFVNSPKEINTSSQYLYVRTEYGRRP